MPTRTAVATAAPLWVRHRVEGPPQQAVIVHRGLHALYAAVTVEARTRCVGVLSARSTFVPCGLRATCPDLGDLLVEAGSPSPGDAVRVGGGAFEIGSVSFHVGRTVDAAVPPLDATASSAMADVLRSLLAGRDAAVRSELCSASLSLPGDGDPAAVGRLLGRGGGLTPVGDDVLCGWLAIIGAARPGPCPVALEVAETADRATTLLSATLLDRARSGDVLPEFRHLLVQLRRHAADGTRGQLETSVERVLAIGHTSGTGLLLGSLLALDHLTHTPPKAGNPGR